MYSFHTWAWTKDFTHAHKNLARDPYPKAFIISLLLINVFIVQQRVGPSATTDH